jgi:hypothetical protein
MREIVGSVIGALVFAFLHAVLAEPMDSFLAWPYSPFVVFAAILAGSLLYTRLIRPRFLGPEAGEYQRLADGVIDQLYLAENQEGITPEGREREHAPEDYRARWYEKFGLRKPKPHKARYR